jgi:anti-sigma regulatory factor (Ser/Thr protein kinase)
LNILNTLLYDDLTQAEMFITLFAAQLNTRTGKLSYANAGHTQTLWWRKNIGQFTYLDATGMPIGVLSVADISESDVYILPGDLLIFYSDGLTDAENSYGEFFGLPRLEELIRKNIKQDAQKVVGDVFSALSAFSKDVAQSDDLTMIVLKIEEREVPFRFEADFAALDEFVQEAYEIVLGYGTPFAYQFQILVSELCTNIVKHAYQGVAGVVYGQIKLEENKVLIDIYDNGNPFDYEARKLPSPDTPQEGGYGLYVINEIADEITYSAQTPKGNHWKIKVNSPKLNDG